MPQHKDGLSVQRLLPHYWPPRSAIERPPRAGEARGAGERVGMCGAPNPLKRGDECREGCDCHCDREQQITVRSGFGSVLVSNSTQTPWRLSRLRN